MSVDYLDQATIISVTKGRQRAIALREQGQVIQHLFQFALKPVRECEIAVSRQQMGKQRQLRDQAVIGE